MPARLALFLLSALVLSGASRELFDGKSLTGWVHEGDRPTFSAEDGAIVCSGLGYYPNWLHTEREYENFRLRFEFKLSESTEAGVIVRAPRLGRPMQAGLGVFLAHDYHDQIGTYSTGSIAGVRPPRNPAKFGFGEWHRAELIADGDRFEVRIDGVEKQNVDLASDAQLQYRLKRGFIGFVDAGYKWWIRAVEIEELPERRQYIDLFDGSTLNGWSLRRGGIWTARDGILTGANGDGNLYAPGEFGDVEFTALVRAPGKVNSGVFFRGSDLADKTRGFEIQIYDQPDAVYPTGSVYNVARARLAAPIGDRWFLLQVIVRGKSCVVRIDGEAVAETNSLPDSVQAPGRVGLQIHSPNEQVEFRDVRARRL